MDSRSSGAAPDDAYGRAGLLWGGTPVLAVWPRWSVSLSNEEPSRTGCPAHDHCDACHSAASTPGPRADRERCRRPPGTLGPKVGSEGRGDGVSVLVGVLTGVVAGVVLGAVLHRGQFCFHSMFAGVWVGRRDLLAAWFLGVAVAAVGLTLLFASPLGDGLSTGLPFRPVANVVGGLVIGAGMAVARSCVSGLFYKLGEGMLGAVVGLVGWVAGELLARQVTLPGPTVLPGGDDGTIPGVLGLPRWLVAVAFLAVVAGVLARRRREASPAHRWQWTGTRLGLALGGAVVLGWVLAALGGASFGPSTVGAAAGVVSGTPNPWLLAFLPGLTLGAFLVARRDRSVRVRGEAPVRYGQLALGGLLLGAGGWIAGGCNLGHGLSGVAQLNVSSWVVVAAMAVGVGLTRSLVTARGGRPDPATTATTRVSR